MLSRGKASSHLLISPRVSQPASHFSAPPALNTAWSIFRRYLVAALIRLRYGTLWTSAFCSLSWNLHVESDICEVPGESEGSLRFLHWCSAYIAGLLWADLTLIWGY